MLTYKGMIERVQVARVNLHAAVGYNPKGSNFIAVDKSLDKMQAALSNKSVAWDWFLNVANNGQRFLHQATPYNPHGIRYKRVDWCFDTLQLEFKSRREPSWAGVGAVQAGGRSLLDLIPTHDTTGIPFFVATDTTFKAGEPGRAPERCVVFLRDTDSHPGEAFFLKGDSGLWYWAAHFDRDWPLGKVFAKGDFLGRVVNTQVGGGPHAHWGINGEAFLGKGKQFKFGASGTGPRYTLGSPSFRTQLEATRL